MPFLQEAVTREALEPDKVLATVLFSDIVGSTARAAELGDARWRELLAAHHGRVRGQLARFRGVELDTAGDGFFARFDGPARAIRCALAIRDAVRELGLEVRLGLHAGECEVLDGKVAAGSPSRSARGCRGWRGPARCWCHKQSKTWSPDPASASTTAAWRS
ncbi:MAG TPA: adenylate/guanylate cyclase domain-containing protein [Streptosporangiaceae bacterium]